MTKLFIGPMSKNTVDVVADICNSTGKSIGLIPSRRQVDYKGGYVNNWTTEAFVEYARLQSPHIVLQRDHGGPFQGQEEESLYHDAKLDFDLLHIDPWKEYKDMDEATVHTINLIKFCNSINPDCYYEIGTEQAIREYKPSGLEKFIISVSRGLGPLFSKVKYAVIQGGTRIEGTRNIGNFDEKRCAAMVEVCNRHGLLSKEHNGDYLTPASIRRRFELGLDSLNIAPEFGVIETQCILEEILNHFDEKSLDRFYSICYDSEKWVKWLPSSVNCFMNEMKKHVIIRTCGHYMFSTEEFGDIKNQYLDVDQKIQRKIKQRIEEIMCAAEL